MPAPKSITPEKLTCTFLILFLFLCSCKGTKVSPSGTDEKGQSIETGIASWYGPGFHGKKTANGETFNTNAMTAAHRTLPFNTSLRVENLSNGKSVKVRINDRGPYAKDRIIDLSKAAAKKLDMINAGTARVELFLLYGSKSDLNVENLKKPTYTIQIASLSDRNKAYARAKNFKEGWVKKAVADRKTVYRVFVGKFTTTTQAQKRNSELKARGVSGFVKQVEN